MDRKVVVVLREIAGVDQMLGNRLHSVTAGQVHIAPRHGLNGLTSQLGLKAVPLASMGRVLDESEETEAPQAAMT